MSGGPRYADAIRATAALALSSGATLVMTVLRSKWVALCFGPEGVGLLGSLTSLSTMVVVATDLGVSKASSRQIAAAGSAPDAVALAVRASQRWTALLGAAGALGVLLFARELSVWTFGDEDHAATIRWLAPVVFVSELSAGYLTTLQGLRRIRQLTTVNTAAAAVATVLTIGATAAFGRASLPFVPLLVAAPPAALAGFTVWRLGLPWVPLGPRALLAALRGLLGLGFTLMMTALMPAFVSYYTRALIVKDLGPEAAGLYQAAWSLSTVYVGVVMGQMGAEYLPRLTALADDLVALRTAINQQAVVLLLMATPGVLFTLAWGPVIMVAAYSRAFVTGAPVLAWLTVGVMLRVVSWPLSFALLARNQPRLYFVIDAGANLLHLAATMALTPVLGLTGVGVAFVSLYVAYWAAMYLGLRRAIGFAYVPEHLRTLAPLLAAALFVHGATLALPTVPAVATGTGVACAVSVACAVRLARLAPDSRLGRGVGRAVGRVRSALGWAP